MRRPRLFFLGLLSIVSAATGLAQTPTPLPVTGNLSQILGGSAPYAGMNIQLYNCPTPTAITGYNVIVQTATQVQADASGLINTSVWPNDLIDCNGTTGASQYYVQYIVNGSPVGSPQCYQVTHTQGTWNLNAQQPITCSQAPPNPQDAQWRNLNITGCLTVNGGPCWNNALGPFLPLAGGTVVGPVISTYTGLDTFLGPLQSPQFIGVQKPVTFTSVMAAGNSLTDGHQGPCALNGDCSWTDFATRATGKTYSNWAVPGQTIEEIGARYNAWAGGPNQTATITGGSLTSGTPVTITFATGYNPARNHANSHYGLVPGVNITICGVNGLVTSPSSGNVGTFLPSATASCAGTQQWTANLTGIVGPGILEVYEGGYNDNGSASILTSFAAISAACNQRYFLGQNAGCFFVGWPASVVRGLNYTLYPNVVLTAVNIPQYTAMAASYGNNWLDLNAAMISNPNVSNPLDVQFTAGPGLVNATPGGAVTNSGATYTPGVPSWSDEAWDITGNIVGDIGPTGCPTGYDAGSQALLYNFGSSIHIDSEVILLADAWTANGSPALACARGANGTTAASHTSGTTFLATDGLHFGSICEPWAPCQGGIPGYQLMANKIVAGIASASTPDAQIVGPAGGLKFTLSGNTTSMILSPTGLQLGGALSCIAGAANCKAGTSSSPINGIGVQGLVSGDISLKSANGGIFADSSTYVANTSYGLQVFNPGTGSYVTSNCVATSGGSGAGMTVNITVNGGGQITNAVPCYNGTAPYADNDVLTLPSGSGDAQVRIFSGKAAGEGTNGAFATSYILGASSALFKVGSTFNPVTDLTVWDPVGGHVSLSARGATIQSCTGAAAWCLYASVAGAPALIGGANTYPMIGTNGNQGVGGVKGIGQNGGDWIFTAKTGAQITDDASVKRWNILGSLAFGAGHTEGTSGQVPTSAGSGNDLTWTTLTDKVGTLIYIGTVSSTGSFMSTPAFPQSITVDAAYVTGTNGPSGCTTWPTMAIVDTDNSNAPIFSFTYSSGTLNNPMTAGTPVLPSGHHIGLRQSAAISGCGTNLTNPSVVYLYH